MSRVIFWALVIVPVALVAGGFWAVHAYQASFWSIVLLFFSLVAVFACGVLAAQHLDD